MCAVMATTHAAQTSMLPASLSSKTEHRGSLVKTSIYTSNLYMYQHLWWCSTDGVERLCLRLHLQPFNRLVWLACVHTGCHNVSVMVFGSSHTVGSTLPALHGNLLNHALGSAQFQQGLTLCCPDQCRPPHRSCHHILGPCRNLQCCSLKASGLSNLLHFYVGPWMYPVRGTQS